MMKTSKNVEPITFTKTYFDYTVVAISSHGDQRYGKFPYSFHLAQVENVLCEADYSENYYRAAAWLHDTIEDTHLTVRDLGALFDSDIALLVWACSGQGGTRKERNETIFKRLREFPEAAPIKCADRIANLAFGIAEGNLTKIKMYLEEWPLFKANVQPLMTKEYDARAPMLFNDLEDWIERAKGFYDKSTKTSDK